jgi:hypothetical protein
MTTNPYRYITRILGPGLLWGRSRDQLLHAIEQARRDGQEDAAGHLERMLRSRDLVCFDAPPRQMGMRPVIQLRNATRPPASPPVPANPPK